MGRTLLLLALVATSPLSARAEPASCAQIMQTIDKVSADISETADAYWKLRKEYVDTKLRGPQEAPKAERLEADAQPLQKSIPSKWAQMKSALSEAQTLNCRPADEIVALREKTFLTVKNINFDRFPEDE